MKFKVLNCVVLLFAFVLFSYGTANAQVVDAVKKAAEKTKDVTVDAAKKTADVTKDVAGKTKNVAGDVAEETVDTTGDVAEGAKDVTIDGAKKTADVVEDGVDVTEDAGVQSYDVVKEGFDDVDDRGIAQDVIEATANGTRKTVYFTSDKASDLGKLGYKATKSVVVRTWDGTKWVGKKTYVFVKDEKKDL